MRFISKDAHDSMKSWDKAFYYFSLKYDYDVSGREIARHFNATPGHVNSLIRIIREGDPRIITLWAKGDSEFTTDSLIKKIILGHASDEEQWQNQIEHSREYIIRCSKCKKITPAKTAPRLVTAFCPTCLSPRIKLEIVS